MEPSLPSRELSMRKAALTSGLAVLVMALTVPVVEFYIFPKLVDREDVTQTIINITAHKSLFSTAIFIHFITVVCDIIVAWGLYIFLKPVNRNLSLLVAWIRLLYTAFNITALNHLVNIIALQENMQYAHLNENVLYHLNAFDIQWRFGLVFFGLYLCLLGYLVFKAGYIPNIIGIVVLVAGLGYMVENLKYFFYPELDTGFLWFTYFGELIFMFWLLLKGSRLKKV